VKNRLFWKIVLVLLVFLWAMVHLGCSAAIDKKMASWQGESANNLIASMGPPDAVLDDGEGGKILVYTAQRTFSSPGYSTSYATGTGTAIGSTYYGSAQGTTIYSPGHTSAYKASRMFWVNKEGYIYRWAWKGL
jgi:hypothetical protein